MVSRQALLCVFACFLVNVAAQDYCPSDMQYNLVVGGSRPRLLVSDNVYQPTNVGSYPVPLFRTYNTGVYLGKGTIMAIEILSQSSSTATGGCVKIQGGGVGYWFVTLNFQAQPGHEINYRVNIYGN
uniref:Salivary secreted peptide n=1 Tax=Riptortus pedestris TaxID=329032 RepID=R4WQY5_RIPPE|nr:unknown secreted protein [Riptortus pedestris]